LRELLAGIGVEWTANNEGGDTWSVFDVLGHLVHGEKTDWLVRTRIILADGEKTFEPFDRFAQFESLKGRTLSDLLDEFAKLRRENLSELRAMNIGGEVLKMRGVHPAFGGVTLSELLAAWVVHDLDHIGQIARIMAKQYETAVGPWYEYLGILHPRTK
jgi:uncharacterized damage-inducible protein DinB